MEKNMSCALGYRSQSHFEVYLRFVCHDREYEESTAIMLVIIQVLR